MKDSPRRSSPIRTMARDMRSHFGSRAWEWILAGMMLGVSYQFLSGGDTVASTRSYAVLAWMGDDDMWGETALTIGGLRLVALIINGSFRRSRYVSPVVRLAASMASIAYWFALCGGLYLVNPHAITVPILFGLILGEAFTASNIAHHIGRGDQRAVYVVAPARGQ